MTPNTNMKSFEESAKICHCKKKFCKLQRDWTHSSGWVVESISRQVQEASRGWHCCQNLCDQIIVLQIVYMIASGEHFMCLYNSSFACFLSFLLTILFKILSLCKSGLWIMDMEFRAVNNFDQDCTNLLATVSWCQWYCAVMQKVRSGLHFPLSKAKLSCLVWALTVMWLR